MIARLFANLAELEIVREHRAVVRKARGQAIGRLKPFDLQKPALAQGMHAAREPAAVSITLGVQPGAVYRAISNALAG